MGFGISVYLEFEVEIHKADSYMNSWNILSLVNSNFERETNLIILSVSFQYYEYVVFC